MKRLIPLIALFFLFAFERASAQAQPAPAAPTDTINLAKRASLSGDDFKFEVNRFYDMMQRKVQLRTFDDCITLIRLFNTLEESAAYQKQPWQPFNKTTSRGFSLLFRTQYLNFMIEKLGFEKRKSGIGYYSAYFKVGIGLTEPPKDADFYQVMWK